MVMVGEEIEDFEMEYFQNFEIKKMKLSDLKGKWVVLLFYPGDFTFVCPTELEEAANKYAEFKKEGAEIISVSTDSCFVHDAWQQHSPAIKKVKYPMAGDPAGKLCRMFGTYIEEEGISLRGTFIIDPDGKLIEMDIHDNSIGRNIEEIFRKLQAAKHVREHPGHVCPASWKPGSKTLKPGHDLVGKI